MSAFDYLVDGETDREAVFNGVCPAVVTNIKDPDNLGKVKVKLLGLDLPDYETGFIRVCTPMTGAECGVLLHPDVGDEVLVAFAGGNISRGYVIGCLRNKNSKPPEEITEKNYLRVIRTKAKNEIKIDDEKDKESISVKTAGGLSVTLLDEKKLITVSDKDGKNLVKIDAENGVMTLEADKKIKLSAGSTELILDSNGSVSLKSDSSFKTDTKKIKLKGDAFEVSADGSLKLSSNGQGSIKCSVLKLN